MDDDPKQILLPIEGSMTKAERKEHATEILADLDGQTGAGRVRSRRRRSTRQSRR
jgi:hypothetical protein